MNRLLPNEMLTEIALSNDYRLKQDTIVEETPSIF